MRIVWLCLASSIVASGSAAVLVGPWTGDVAASTADVPRLPPPRPLDESDTTRSMPLPRWLASPASRPATLPAFEAGSDCGRGVARTLPCNDSEVAALEAELADLQLQLRQARDELGVARQRLTELVADHCEERFDLELDEWLDGSLGWLHEGDDALRERLSDTLTVAAWDLLPRDEGDCPVTVGTLRAALPDGVVVQLATLFRDWDRESERPPTVKVVGCCGNAPSDRTVVLQFATQELRLPLDHPLVRAIREDKQRVDRDWESRINALLRLPLYDLD